MTAAEAKSGKYTYYVCHSLLKRGSDVIHCCKVNLRTKVLYLSSLVRHANGSLGSMTRYLKINGPQAPEFFVAIGWHQ